MFSHSLRTGFVGGGHLSSTTVLHYNAGFVTQFAFIKILQLLAIWILHLATFQFIVQPFSNINTAPAASAVLCLVLINQM